MKDFYHDLKNRSPHKLPKVLGLTACLMVKAVRVEKFHEERRILEQIMDSRVETTTDLYEILKYVTAPSEEFCFYPTENVNNGELYQLITSHCNVANEKLCEIFEKEKSRLKNLGNNSNSEKAKEELGKDYKVMKNNTIQNILDGISDLGLISIILNFPGFKAQAERNCSKALKVFYAAEVRREMDQVMLECLCQVDSVVRKIPHSDGSYQSLRKLSSAKVLHLMEKLKTASQEEEQRAIVFVEKQYHAETLCRILREFAKCDAELSNISTDFAYSPGSNLNVKDPNQREIVNNNRRRLRETLAKFKDGRVNTLVATSVIEEGLDVRTCNLVIKFDFPSTFRSYVQSKGRARAKPSKYILMISHSDREKKEKAYNSYRAMEDLSMRECHHRNEDDEPHVNSN